MVLVSSLKLSPVPKSNWVLALLSVEPAIVELGVVASAKNLRVQGIHSAQHHRALLASLRVGCNAYATAEEALQGANVVFTASDSADVPSTGQECLVLRLVPGSGFQCPPLQRPWAEEFLGFLGGSLGAGQQ